MSTTASMLLALAVAYGGTWVWLWESWQVNDYYSHGPLVAALIPVLLWWWRRSWREPDAAFSPRAWCLLVPALLLHAAGALLMIDSLSAASLVLALPAIAWLTQGPARARRMLPVLLLVAFAIPLPLFVSGRVAFELKELAVESALAIANGLGLGAVREGAYIRIPGQEKVLLVADPCSGLRSLVALTTVGYVLAFLVGKRPLWRRLVLLGLAVPIALVANVLRIAGICWLSRTSGVDFATGTGHDVLGGAEWLLALLLLVGADAGLARIGRGRAS